MDTFSIALFAKAALVGLLIAAPVGPIGLLTIRRTLEQGRAAGGRPAQTLCTAPSAPME